MTHNLPAALTTFVGRSTELSDIEKLISERRMVTLSGVGGCGKTRLALQLGARLADRWPHGFWLADLGSVNDPALIPGLTASALGMLLDPRGQQVEALADKLGARQLLLCLDTCEHVLDATALLADTLLRRCPGVSILATSREPLGVEGETVWPVPTLRPDEAIALFADRAGLVAPRFDVAESRDEVAAVCARVDHIPLAIELAAAWVRALSPAQIAADLDDRLRLLAGSARRAIPRHQTLLTSMAWSHGLLNEEEKVLFRRLAVFSGTFTLEAAASICIDADAAPGPDEGSGGSSSGGSDRGSTGRPGALQLVGRLLDKSLVTVRESRGEFRYRLLDTIRQYAEELLQAAGESANLRDRHLDHFLALAEDAQAGLEADQDTWRETLEGHRDNINAALQWGLSALTEHADRGRRLAAAMARQWFIRSQSAEGLDFLRRAIELAPTDRSALQGRLHAGTAMLGMISGRTDLLTDAAARGLELATETGDDVTRARCLTMAAYPYFFVDFPRCEELAGEARAAGEAAGDPFARDWAPVLEGYSLQTRNRHDEAVAMGRLAFERSWPRGDRFTAAFARGIEIFVELVGGNPRRAVTIADEVVRIVTPLADYFAVGTNTANAALAVAMAGDIARARTMMDPIVRSVDTAPEADVVGFMVPYALMHLWDGDLQAAVGWFERGVRRMSEETSDWTAARCLPGYVGALRRLGRLDEAAEWAARAVRVETEFDAPYELSNVLDEQARLSWAADARRARDLHLEALTVRRGAGLRTTYVDSLDALAGLEAGMDNHAEAVRLLAVSEAAREDLGYPRPPVDRPDHDALVATLRTCLGPERFDALWRDGAAMSLGDAAAVLTRGRGPRDRPGTGWESLTPTELEVVQLVSAGLSNPEIAGRLYVSRSTVKTHLAHIYAKVGVANRTELATLASSERGDD